MKIKTKYLVLAALGALLTPTAIDHAFNSRGYIAFGGEFLIIPLFLLAGLIVESVRDMGKEI